MTGLGTSAALEGADALVRTDLLRPGMPLEFVHPLVRGAVYEQLPLHERVMLHAYAARVLAPHDASAEKVCAHLLRAEPAEDPAAVQVLRTAARRAVAQGLGGVWPRAASRLRVRPRPPGKASATTAATHAPSPSRCDLCPVT